jgi:lipopolysaccharide/colanic/teichoic acid biosynthesis glycosyltransferase
VVKRIFDLVCAGLGLLVLSPLFLAIAVAVKLSGPGPVFFRQERVGQDFVRFRIYKFRTMTGDNAANVLLTVRGDPRVTSAGRFLRRTKFDELPQLINVVRGEMSLVGPRPEVPKYVEMYHDDYEEILTVRPGITDEASVQYRNEESVLAEAEDPQETYVKEVLPKKIALAKQYLRQRNLIHDIQIVLRTLTGL